MSDFREYLDRPEAAECASRQLVGAVRVEPDAVQWADVEPEAMPTPEARAVWRVLVEHTREHPGEGIDEIAIASRARVDVEWVVACEGIATRAEVAHFAAVIRKHADRRKLLAAIADLGARADSAPVDLAEKLDSGGTAGEVLQSAASRVLAALAPPEASRAVSLAEACRAFTTRPAPDGGAWFPWPGPVAPSVSAGPVMKPEDLAVKPWDRWENLASIAAIGPESVAVLVGPTGRGKTALALQMALAVAAAGHRVLYASAELPADELVARSIACKASGGIPWRAILTAYGDRNVKRVADELAAMPEGQNLHLWTPTGRNRNVDALQLVARQREARFVVVDYLQRFLDDADDKRIAAMRASGQLRDLSRKAHGWPGAAVLAVSSIARTAYQSFASVEKLRALQADDLIGSGKEAGELEYDATLVLAYTADPPKVGEPERSAVVRVVKQRAGQSEGEAAFRFHGAAGRFTPCKLTDRSESPPTPKPPPTGQQGGKKGVRPGSADDNE